MNKVLRKKYLIINEKQQYYKYFWYEPKQNQDISSITYSPKKNIKDFIEEARKSGNFKKNVGA